jgi:hypothetical protein
MHGWGLRLANRFGRRRLIWLEIITGFHLTGALTALRFFRIYPTVWWPIFGAMAFGSLAYASKSRAEQDRADKEIAELARTEAEKQRRIAEEQARTTEVATLCRYKGQTAGTLAQLLKALHERSNHARTLQGSFLRHAVDVVKDYLNLSRDDDRISATWVIPVDNYTNWETVAYDRDQAARQPGRRRPIRPGTPGAAEAFLSGDQQFIEDTLDAKNAKHFDRAPVYRSILSIPARTRNVTRNANVTIEGQPNAIVGVLNIDCRVTGVLHAHVAGVVGDIAYLIGVLEHINQNLGGGLNG